VTPSDPGYERGYRIACRVRDTLFVISVVGLTVILGGPLWYEMGI
jgi:hypothetical protein